MYCGEELGLRVLKNRECRRKVRNFFLGLEIDKRNQRELRLLSIHCKIFNRVSSIGSKESHHKSEGRHLGCLFSATRLFSKFQKISISETPIPKFTLQLWKKSNACVLKICRCTTRRYTKSSLPTTKQFFIITHQIFLLINLAYFL